MILSRLQQPQRAQFVLGGRTEYRASGMTRAGGAAGGVDVLEHATLHIEHVGARCAHLGDARGT
jgi:hypothetical protein